MRFRVRPLTAMITVFAAPAFAGLAGAALAAATPPERDQVLEEVLVTARPYGQTQFDALLGTTVLSGEDLDRRADITLGETLSGLPGLSSNSFAPGASRPIIRGLDGSRVSVLSDGIGSIDASVSSPDHAVAIEPVTAERLEIIRGPATLLYGSSAVGGVVNVIDGRIPTQGPENGVSGGVRGGYSTVNRGWEGSAAMDVELDSLVFHVDGYRRDTGDLRIPGYAESDQLRAMEGHEDPDGDHDEDHEDEDVRGRVPNSDMRTKGGAVGLSHLFDGGFIGVSVGRKEMNYGLPFGHDHEHGDEEGHDPDPGHEDEHGDDDEGVRIDLRQARFDLKGELNRDMGLFETARLRFGHADYTHSEIDDGEVETIFNNKGWETRLEMVQKERGGWRGASGVQVMNRDFEAIGEEAFVPPSDTTLYGLFTVQEFRTGDWTVEAGGRIERQRIKAGELDHGHGHEDQGDHDDEDHDKRTFTGVSLSGALAYDFADGWRTGVNLARSERLPTAEELFSNGPHLATNSFEIGDPDLTKESVWSAEFTVRNRQGPLRGSVNLFYNRFSDYVFQSFTGAIEDDLDVLAYEQANAVFWGGELDLRYAMLDREDLRANLLMSADMVRARLRESGDRLPRIPARTLTTGVEVLSRYVDASLELKLVDGQDRVADYELRTGGYAFLNASVSVHPFPDTADFTLSVIARNIGDREARNHTSLTKDQLPLPGRDVRFVALYRF